MSALRISPALLGIPIGTMLLLGGANAQELDPVDPYFMQTPAKKTAYMPRVIIRNLRQDGDGNIWIASFGGPIRYDGEAFVNVGEQFGLADRRIFSVLIAKSGAVWLGSITGGAARLDDSGLLSLTEGEIPSPVGPSPESSRRQLGGLPSNDVLCLYEDLDANIWIATSKGLSRFDGKELTHFSTKDGLLHNSVYAIAQDPTGRMWFGTQGGVCSYDGKTFRNLADQVERTFENVRALTVDAAGHVWFGGQDGGFFYDGKTLRDFTADSKNGLLSNFVGSILIAKNGDVWFGHPGGFPDFTGGGATRYDGTSFEQISREDGLTVETVYGMLEDQDGNIWFGSADAGVCRYDGKTFVDMSKDAPR